MFTKKPQGPVERKALSKLYAFRTKIQRMKNGTRHGSGK
jgi:hypothetical protein